MKTGLKQAKRMLLLPEKLFLEEAVKHNIVTKKVPLESLEKESEEFCQNLASKPINIVYPIKLTLNKMHLQRLDRDFDLERKGFEMFMKNNLDEIMKYSEELFKN